MSKRPFLTSALAIGLALPFFSSAGDVSNNSMCSGDTFGSSEHVKLRAKWTAQSGSCEAGKYLNGSNAQCSDCPAGYYCNGLASYIYDGNDQGITSKCPGGYTSVPGAASANDCFRSIFTPCTNINPYTGSGKATSAVYGNSNGGNTECRMYYGSATCVTQNENACEITDLNCTTGYHTPDLINLNQYILSPTTDSRSGYVTTASSSSWEYFGLVEPNTWAKELYLDYEYFGIVYGSSKCLSKDGYSSDSNAPYKTLDRDSSELNKSGGYCWCQMTGYKENTGSDMISAISDWVYSGDDFSWNPENCDYNCANYCAERVRYYGSDLFYKGFRYQLFTTAKTPKVLECQVNTYTCKPGEYMTGSTGECAICPAGYYCGGGEFTFNGRDQGIDGQCSSGFTSDEGSSSESACHRPCSVSDVEHATSVSGGWYGNVNMCNAESCAYGWTIKSIIDEKDASSANSNPTNSINSACVSLNGNFSVWSNWQEKEYWGFESSENNVWAIEYQEPGIIRGVASCNSTPNNEEGKFSADTFSTETSGQYCWCKVDSMKPNNSSKFYKLYSSWVYNRDFYDADECANRCAAYCPYEASYNRWYLVSSPKTCELYSCNAGKYLTSNGECMPCPSGYYCNGGEWKLKNSDQGIDGSCPSGYTSDMGAISINDCYRACELSDIDHATAISDSGKYYYNGSNSCNATACADGWTFKQKMDINSDYSRLRDNNSYSNSAYAYIDIYNNYYYGRKTAEYFSLTEPMTWARDFSNNGNIVYGRASCNDTYGENSHWSSNPDRRSANTFNSESTGQYCWCQITSYKPGNNAAKQEAVSDWLYLENDYDNSNCASKCAKYCAFNEDIVAKFGDSISYLNMCVMYSCAAGKYLNSEGVCETCPSGSYCAGGSWANDGEPHGIDGTCPSGYTSDMGAISINSCYRPCDVDFIEHATAITDSGKYYYNGENTCSATACAYGWTLSPIMNIANDYDNLHDPNAYSNSAYGYIDAYQTYYFGKKSAEYFSLTEPMTWARDFSNNGNIIYGRASCNNTYLGGSSIYYNSNPDTKLNHEMSPDSSGRYCWCQVTSYQKGVDTIKQSAISKWAYLEDRYNDASCNSECAKYCALNYDIIPKFSNLIEYANICAMYSCAAGKYLSSEGICETCPAGYYCTGGDWALNGTDQGITDLCPDGYDSKAGAGAITDCYRPCDIENIEHATAISSSGNYYYGGAYTCSATECAYGWTLKPKFDLGEDFTTASNTVGYAMNSNYASLDFNMSSYVSGNAPLTYYGLSEPMTWAHDFTTNGNVVYGRASCNDTYVNGNSIWSSNPDKKPDGTFTTDSTGYNCWCQITSYKPGQNAAIQEAVSDWIFYDRYYYYGNPTEYCANNCARYCANENNVVSKLADTITAPSMCGMHSCMAGKYLNENGECTPCPSGSYCEGGEWVHNGSVQGITGTCPSGYTSDEGAFSTDQCYRPCSVSDKEHALEVSGGTYYNGINTCDITSCANGWEIKEIFDLEGLNSANSNPVNSINSAVINQNGEFYNNPGGKSKSYYAFTSSDRNVWATEYTSHGIIRGSASCNEVTKNEDGKLSEGTFTRDSTGSYCWCKVDAIKPKSESEFQNLRSYWVFYRQLSSASECAYNCASSCSYVAGYNRWYLVSAPKVCELKTYHCEAGEYLNAEHEACETCPAGSYCAGGTFTYATAESSTAACPSGYTSDSGAGAESQCYIASTASCAIINPDTSDVSMSAVYGNSTNGTAPCKTYYGSSTCTLDVANACDITEITCAAGWTPKVELDLSSAELTFTNSAFGYISAPSENTNNTASYRTSGAKIVHDQTYYGLTTNNTWAIESAEGDIIYGQARCSTQPGTNNDWTWSDPTTIANLADETGETGSQYCYCNVIGHKADNTSAMTSLSSSWVFSNSYGEAASCAAECASACAFRMDNTGFRSALFETASTPLTCTPNTLNIEWYDNGSMTTSNTCTYNQTITLPATPAPREGLLFRGWRLVRD